MPDVGWPELLIILIVALVIFGPKRLPDLGKSLGKGVREFKNGINGLHEHFDGESEADRPKPVAGQAAVPESRPEADVITGEVVGEETVPTQSETRATA